MQGLADMKRLSNDWGLCQFNLCFTLNDIPTNFYSDKVIEKQLNSHGTYVRCHQGCTPRPK